MGASLDRLSALIDPEQRLVDVRHAPIWQDLVRYLRWQKHPDPEEGAQETIVRALSRIDCEDAWKEASEDPRRYFFAFAWCVAREGWRPSREEPLEERLFPHASVHDPYVGIYLQELLGKLDDSERALLIRYHTEDRVRLSRRLGISIGTLRVQIHRICRRLTDLATSRRPG